MFKGGFEIFDYVPARTSVILILSVCQNDLLALIEVSKGMKLIPRANMYVTFIEATKTSESPGLGVVAGSPE